MSSCIPASRRSPTLCRPDSAGGCWTRDGPARLVGRFTREGRIIKTTSVRGFLLLYGVASLRRIRRASLRYRHETARISQWLSMIADAAVGDLALALEIAECQRLVKGYGDTHVRGTRNFEKVMDALAVVRGRADAGEILRGLRDAGIGRRRGSSAGQRS
jgi:indolepyruvate ferredoxin oxidoreductase beta subunit